MAFGFFKKKQDFWKATFKTLGSAYSYSKPGDVIVLQEPVGDYSEMQFARKLDEYMYKYKVNKLTEPTQVAEFWEVQLERG